jgi:hypothetical protein
MIGASTGNFASSTGWYGGIRGLNRAGTAAGANAAKIAPLAERFSERAMELTFCPPGR